MQILFNELSLEGQFADQNDFIDNAVLPFISILKEMKKLSVVLLKKSDVWQKKITSAKDFHSFVVARPATDEARRLKSAIASLEKEPFWDSESRQLPTTTYLLGETDIGNTSPAEACERDRTVVSFVRSWTSSDPLNVEKNGNNVNLLNLLHPGVLSDHLWKENLITFESYLMTRFSGGKLDFSKVDNKMGFSRIGRTDQSPFVSTFEKLEGLTWDQIHSDKGLNYKEYRGNIDLSYRRKKTYKFRVSEKFRCHGYRERDLFVVIGFETDHKMSDRG